MSTEQFQALIKQAKHLSAEERRQLIEFLEEAERRGESDQSAASTDYVALFGSGRSGFATAAEADEFIRNERDAWEN